MTAAFDFSALVGGCVRTLIALNTHGFWLTGCLGLFLAAVGWWLCARHAHLWNRAYHLRPGHHVLCAMAALLTLIFTVVFASLAYTENAARSVITAWEQAVNADAGWQSTTFARAYDAVRALGLENFANYPVPADGGSIIPLTRPESQLKAAGFYADAAAEHFRGAHPFLSLIVRAQPEVPTQAVNDDVTAFFRTHRERSYPAPQAVALAAGQLERGLTEQASRVVPLSRVAVGVLFLFAQAIPFGLIGWTAYRDLRTHV